ncbi:hypothetical protein B0H14DRAFT_2620453 [Mycena olivaceomarginata]|nr:hypothetical protein B0H14DRAFT_2620453 [Mycena olivaceomarginata]
MPQRDPPRADTQTRQVEISFIFSLVPTKLPVDRIHGSRVIATWPAMLSHPRKTKTGQLLVGVRGADLGDTVYHHLTFTWPTRPVGGDVDGLEEKGSLWSGEMRVPFQTACRSTSSRTSVLNMSSSTMTLFPMPPPTTSGSVCTRTCSTAACTGAYLVGLWRVTAPTSDVAAPVRVRARLHLRTLFCASSDLRPARPAPAPLHMLLATRAPSPRAQCISAQTKGHAHGAGEWATSEERVLAECSGEGVCTCGRGRGMRGEERVTRTPTEREKPWRAYIFATQALRQGEEIIVGRQWDDANTMHQGCEVAGLTPTTHVNTTCRKNPIYLGSGSNMFQAVPRSYATTSVAAYDLGYGKHSQGSRTPGNLGTPRKPLQAMYVRQAGHCTSYTTSPAEHHPDVYN